MVPGVKLLVAELLALPVPWMIGVPIALKKRLPLEMGLGMGAQKLDSKASV
jgi:hypothetical protein